MIVLGKVVDFFFPHFCPACGEVDQLLCNKCERELGTATQICPVCNEESLMGWTHKQCKSQNSLDGLISLFEYGDPCVRKVIDNIKYDFNSELIPRLFEKIKIEAGIDFNFLVPVPLHFHRNNWRGFNQADLIAKALESQMDGVKNIDLLIRSKNTVQQVKMVSRSDRQQNVVEAFVLNSETDNADLVGKKVLLVDDVFTTGASMNECCKALKKAGVGVVWGFALAH